MQRPWHAYYPDGVPPVATYPSLPLWGFLQRAVQAHPERVALLEGARRISYGELWREVEAIAGRIRPGDRVILRLGSGRDFVQWFYGVLLGKGIVCAQSPVLSKLEREAQEADVEPTWVVDTDGMHSRPGVRRIHPEIAVLQYTSGTTGRSKAAIMSHANLVANALQNTRWFRWSADEIVLGNMPFYHTWGMCVCLNSTFAVGGTLALLGEQEPHTAVRSSGATVMYGSATFFHRLLASPLEADSLLRSLRHVKAGAMLSQGQLKKHWDARIPWAPLQQGYGLTEASPEAHNNPPQRFKEDTVGVPLQDTDCRVCDPEDPSRVLPVGEAGEVQLQGPQVTRGYWKAPEVTREAFHDGWLRTGDLGVMDEEGYLRIVDRLKDLLKFRGWSVSPNIIEECLLQHPAVAEAVVVGKPDPVDGDVPTAFVVARADVTADNLQGHCRERLAPYEVPRRVFFVDAIPKNAVGKPLRRKLRDRIGRGE